MQRRTIAWCASWGVALFACGPTLGVRAQLVTRAQEQFACEHGLTVRQLTENAFEVSGCGRMVEYTDTEPGSGREFRSMTPAAALAVADTSCALDAIQPVGDQGIDARTLGGCGVTARYRLACVDDGGCHWMLAGTPQRAAAAPPVDSIITPVPPPPSADQGGVSP